MKDYLQYQKNEEADADGNISSSDLGPNIN